MMYFQCLNNIHQKIQMIGMKMRWIQHIVPDEADELLPSVKHRRRKTEEEKCLKRCSKKNIILLMSLVNRFLKPKGT